MTAIAHPMDSSDPQAPERVTCTAHNRAGNRCGRPPEPGTNVCRYHGGAAPQVRRKAALRLLELVDPAIGTLAREMVQADKSSDRQRAANSILDRAGVPRMVREVDGETAREVLLQRLQELRGERAQVEAPESPASPPSADEAPDSTIIEGETE